MIFSLEAVRAILTLAFDKQNKTEMIEKKEWNVIESLEKISESPDEKVKEISRKALWTITDKHFTCKYAILKDLTNNNKYMVNAIYFLVQSLLDFFIFKLYERF